MKKKYYFFLSGKFAGGLFLAPTLLVLLSLAVFPFLFSLYLSFSRVIPAQNMAIEFIGFQNWSELIEDGRYWNSLRNTAFIVLMAVIIQYIAGLSLALILNKDDIKGNSFFRVLFLIPMMVTPIGIGFMWRMLFDPSAGPINDILSRMGFPFIGWLSRADLAIYPIIVGDIWQWTPFMFLILLAGLQLIPDEVVEASRIDGCSGWQVFRFVIFPLLIPVSISALMLRIIEAFKIIDLVYIITGGGPGSSTETTTLYTYIMSMRRFQLGYGSTIGYAFFLMILVFCIIFLLSARKQLEEMSE